MNQFMRGNNNKVFKWQQLDCITEELGQMGRNWLTLYWQWCHFFTESCLYNTTHNSHYVGTSPNWSTKLLIYNECLKLVGLGDWADLEDSNIQIFKCLVKIFSIFKLKHSLTDSRNKISASVLKTKFLSVNMLFIQQKHLMKKCRNGCFFFQMKLKRKISEKLNTWFISAYNKRRWRSSLCLCFILKSASQHLSGPLVSNMMAIRFQQSR